MDLDDRADQFRFLIRDRDNKLRVAVATRPAPRPDTPGGRPCRHRTWQPEQCGTPVSSSASLSQAHRRAQRLGLAVDARPKPRDVACERDDPIDRVQTSGVIYGCHACWSRPAAARGCRDEADESEDLLAVLLPRQRVGARSDGRLQHHAVGVGQSLPANFRLGTLEMRDNGRSAETACNAVPQRPHAVPDYLVTFLAASLAFSPRCLSSALPSALSRLLPVTVPTVSLTFPLAFSPACLAFFAPAITTFLLLEQSQRSTNSTGCPN